MMVRSNTESSKKKEKTHEIQILVRSIWFMPYINFGTLVCLYIDVENSASFQYTENAGA